MQKWIKILAASVGGGIALGTGIRLAEAIAGRGPGAPPNASQDLLSKLDAVERRLLNLEKENSSIPSPANPPREAGPGDFEALAARMADLETRLRAESERDRKETLDALVEGIQARVVQRISTLEDQVAGQSAAVAELRECTLRTERGVQRLLGGIDRLIAGYPAVRGDQEIREKHEKLRA